MKLLKKNLPLFFLLFLSFQALGQMTKAIFKGEKIKLHKADIIKVVQGTTSDVANDTMQSLTAVENTALQLAVLFEMEENIPNEKGLFVFKIISEKQVSLSVELFDEEGFTLNTQGELTIRKGNNYKALDISELDAGKYFLKLKDDAGKELLRAFFIQSRRGVQTVDFQGSQVRTSNADVILVTKPADAKQDDDTIKGIMRSLVGAENVNPQLDVKFHMSDEPVEEGLFVFGMESESDIILMLSMYDEEGFELKLEPDAIQINAGNNYKALNVNSLEDGKYFFKLKDDAGKELVREVTIAHKN